MTRHQRRTAITIPLLCALSPLVGLTLVTTLAVTPRQKAPKPATPTTFEKVVPMFLNAHCMGCHRGATAAAGLSLEPFLKAESLQKETEIWKQIVHKVRLGQMPPPGSPRPNAARSKQMTGWVTTELDQIEKRLKPEAGRVTARRLNRAEYNNTVRDLLGVTTRPADDFPQDDSGYGFDNIGDVLSLSPPLLEKYLATAEKVAREALFGPEARKPLLIEVRAPRRSAPPPDGIPAKYDETGLTMFSGFHANYRFPADGKYLFQVALTGLRPAITDPIRIALYIDGKKMEVKEHLARGVETFPGGPFELYGMTVPFSQWPVTAGDHWIAFAIEKQYEGFPPSFGGPNPTRLPQPPVQPRRGFGPQEPPKDATPEQIARFKERQKQFQERAERQQKELINNTRLNYALIGGPYEQRTQPTRQSRMLLYTCGHLDGKHTIACMPKIVGDFAKRAFRRPVTSQELAPYLRLAANVQKQEKSFDEGLCVAVQALLVSPHFLFRIERDTTTASASAAYPISDHELATRLSYFLWSTMPDAELTRCADTKTLRKPAVLKAQVERMLRDPKANALVENFAGQWLELRKLESLKPDQEKFREYDEYLRLSMRRETELFFREIILKDRPILDFIDADYTFLNGRLAEFYGMPPLEGTEFRKVTLKGTNRGGVLTQASVLTVTSFPTRTSPVLRGKWILENFLNTPPPPPPPDVPALEETKVADGASLRDQLEEHRKKPLCASCHARLDPLGFGLENFDGIGAWRTVDGKTPIEASGSLPDGKSFSGPQQLKAILMQDKDAFTRCLTTKLLTYALGRGLERYDQPTVKQIAASVAKDNYRFSRLVLSIVTSLPFQQRKGNTTRESPLRKASLAPNGLEGHGRDARTAAPRRDGSRVRGGLAGR